MGGKDNSVKANSLLKFIYEKWAETYYEGEKKALREYPTILDDAFEDLEIANALCGRKIVSSFLDLSKKNILTS